MHLFYISSTLSDIHVTCEYDFLAPSLSCFNIFVFSKIPICRSTAVLILPIFIVPERMLNFSMLLQNLPWYNNTMLINCPSIDSLISFFNGD